MTTNVNSSDNNETLGKPQGWRASLSLCYSGLDRQGDERDKTRLIHKQQFGPLSVQRAFYPEGHVCHQYLLHPPGGLVAGDKLDINIMVKPKGHTLITTPGASKFYRTDGKVAACQFQHLAVEADATLEWFPHENIFFNGAIAKVKTDIHLNQTSRFMGWEFNCLGRPCINETFIEGEVQSRTQLHLDGTLLFVDSLVEKNQQLAHSPAGLHGFSMQGSFIIYPANQSLLELARDTIKDVNLAIVLTTPIGATLLDNLLVIRALADNTEEIHTAFCEIWRRLRPVCLQRQASPPRIWNT